MCEHLPDLKLIITKSPRNKVNSTTQHFEDDQRKYSGITIASAISEGEPRQEDHLPLQKIKATHPRYSKTTNQDKSSPFKLTKLSIKCEVICVRFLVQGLEMDKDLNVGLWRRAETIPTSVMR